MKNNEQKRRLFISAALFLTMAITQGCAIHHSFIPNRESDAQYYDTMLCAGFASEDGIYHKNNIGFLYFFDYQSMQDVIVCNKPNCTHSVWYENTPDEQRCNAYLPDSLGGSGFALNDSLYIFNESLNTQTTSLIRSNPDRSGQTETAAFENNIVLPFIVDEPYLYMSGCSILTEKNEDGMENPTGENETWLFRVDLETGKVTELTERKKAYSSDLYIIGFYNGKIYYKESRFEKKFDGRNYEEAGHQVDWYSYDITTDQSERIYKDQNFQDAYLYKNKLVCMLGKNMTIESYQDESQTGRYRQTELTVRDLDKDKSRPVAEADQVLDYADGKVFYIMDGENGRHYYYYDTETEKTTEMSRKFMENLHIRGAFGDYLLIIKDDPDTGYGDQFVILKQDFYEEKDNYIPIRWKEES